jgi:hypothetical protein
MTDDLKRVYGEDLTVRIRATAQRLRDLATLIDGLADQVPNIGTPGRTNAASIAHSVVHEMAWGTANASVAAIVAGAAEYDRVVTYAPEGGAR